MTLLLWAGVARATTYTVCASGCDYTTLHDALAAVVNGDSISITDATLTVSASTSCSRSNLTITGAPTVVDLAYAGSGLYLQGNNQHLTDLTFQTTSELVYIESSVDTLYMTNVAIAHTGAQPYLARIYPDVAYLSGCTFTGQKTYFVCDSLSCLSTTFDGDGDDVYALSACEKAHYESCTFTDYYLYDYYISGTASESLYVASCTFDMTTIGADFWGVKNLSDDRTHTTITGSSFTSNYARLVTDGRTIYGFQSNDNGATFDISGCVFSYMKDGIITSIGGTAAAASSGCTIENNVFDHCKNHSLHLTINSSTIAYNHITGGLSEFGGVIHGLTNGTEDAGNIGADRADGNLYHHNTFDDCSYGLVDKGNNTRIYSNTCNGVEYPILMKGAHHVLVAGNTITGSNAKGVCLESQNQHSPDNCAIVNNLIIGGTYGIYFTTADLDSGFWHADYNDFRGVSAVWYDGSSSQALSVWQARGYDKIGALTEPNHWNGGWK